MEKVIFWAAFALLFYSFIGYGMLLWLLVKIKRLATGKRNIHTAFEPAVTLVIPCYNEAPIIEQKIKNSLSLDYPSGKLQIIFITDGSTDNTQAIISNYPQIEVLHSAGRGGKTAAENRAMQYVSTPFVVFSDANTLLNAEAIKKIVQPFSNEKVGCVSGEKRILVKGADIASAAGEGLYWKYESMLKRLDSELYSAVGAAGELVAFRTSLYEAMPEDTILDDFIQSMYIAAKGFTIIYEPDAYAIETAAASIKEELKRKIRICAGGWQSIHRLSGRLSFYQSPVLFFQYVSHRVLRWTVNPFLMMLMLLTTIWLAPGNSFYSATLIAQIVFYAAAAAGYIFETKHLKIKAFFLPYYFCIMNYAVVIGLFRFLKGSQSAVWEKNARMSTSLS